MAPGGRNGGECLADTGQTPTTFVGAVVFQFDLSSFCFKIV